METRREGKTDIADFFGRYAHATAVVYVPAVFCLTLVYLLTQRKNAAVTIDKTVARSLLYYVTYAFSAIPLLWLIQKIRTALIKLRGGAYRFSLRTLRNTILLLGIFSAHAVSLIGYKGGSVSRSRCMTLLLYDLFFVGFFFYYKTDRGAFARGVKALSVLLWISALYGILEHFTGERLPFLYTVADKNRVNAFYSNPIPASSIWLMGLWLPALFKRGWKNWIWRLVYVAAIVFTLSKNAWIGLVFSLLIYLYRRRSVIKIHRSWKRIILLCIGIAAAAAMFFLLGQNSAFWQSALQRWTDVQTKGSFYARLNHITDTLKYLSDEAPFARRLFGFGFGTSPAFIKSSPHYYGISVIDNQYITCLYEFGIIAVVCLAVWVLLVLSGSETEDALSRAGVMGWTAMLFPLATYEPFTWIPVAFLLAMLAVPVLCDAKAVIRRQIVCIVGLLLAAVVLLALLYPNLLSWGKSVYQALSANGSAGWIRALPGILLLYMLLLIAGITLTVRRRGSRHYILPVLFCMVVAPMVFGQAALGKVKGQLASTLEEEAAILETVTEYTAGSVYCDAYPWLYRQRYGQIRASVFNGEEIVLTDENTVIVDRGYVSPALFGKGYLFVEISDRHAIYTNDQAVIDRLQEQGVHLWGYYNLEKTFDADTDLSAAVYTLRFVLPLPAQDNAGETEVDGAPGAVAVQMTNRDTGALLFQEEIAASDWETKEGGSAEMELPVWISTAGNYDLSVESAPGLEIKVYYRITPEYDIHRIYNQADRLVEEVYYTPAGEPTLHKNGYHKIRYTYNKKGYNTKQSFLGLDEEPVVTSEGHAYYVKEYDSQARLARERWLGLAGEPVIITSGFAIRERAYDADGNLSDLYFKGTEEEPINYSAGYVRVHYAYDSERRRISESYWDADGNRMVVSSGEAEKNWEYDENGDAVLETYRGLDGAEGVNFSGYAAVRRTYDQNHRIIREEYLDLAGEPFTVSGGYASVTYSYNSMGDRVCYQYCDAQGELVLNSSGYAQLCRTFDAAHRVLRDVYEDAEGNPIALSSGQTAVAYAYDGAGNLNRYTYLDAEGNTVTLSGGYAGLHNTFNQRRQILQTEYLDAQGAVVTLPSGIAIETYAYDLGGNRIEWDYCDSNAQPVMRPEGYSQLHRSYNPIRQITEEWYCDTEGERIELPAGYASKEYTYDANGIQQEVTYYNLAGEAVDPQ